jgi:hypothetical protein
MGIGLGLMMTPANTDAMNTAAPRLRGQASGVIQTMRQVGATIGIAVMGAIVANVQNSRIGDAIASSGVPSVDVDRVERGISEAATTGHAPGSLTPSLIDSVKEAVTSGVSSAYAVAAGVTLVAALLAALLLRREKAADAPPDPEAEPAGASLA